MTKRFILLNLIPVIVTNIIAIILSNLSVIMGQLVILPIYFVILLGIYVSKYKFSIIKGFVIQSIIMFAALYILAVIMVLYGVIAMGMTFAEAVETFGHIGFETVHLMIAMSIMLPGTVIIAVISHIKKRKSGKTKE